MVVAFYVRFSTFLLNLVRIDPIVQKWQPIFDNHDGGGRHLEFWCMYVPDMTVVFYIEFAKLPSNLVKIGLIVKNWQRFFECRDGGSPWTKQNTSFEPWNVRIGPELRPVGEKRKRKQMKKGEHKSQNRDVSPLCGGAPCEPISITFGVFIGLINIITYVKSGPNIVNGFSRPTGEKIQVSYRKAAT